MTLIKLTQIEQPYRPVSLMIEARHVTGARGVYQVRGSKRTIDFLTKLLQLHQPDTEYEMQRSE